MSLFSTIFSCFGKTKSTSEPKPTEEDAQHKESFNDQQYEELSCIVCTEDLKNVFTFYLINTVNHKEDMAHYLLVSIQAGKFTIEKPDTIEKDITEAPVGLSKNLDLFQKRISMTFDLTPEELGECLGQKVYLGKKLSLPHSLVEILEILRQHVIKIHLELYDEKENKWLSLPALQRNSIRWLPLKNLIAKMESGQDYYDSDDDYTPSKAYK